MKILFFANTDWHIHNFRLGLARYLREQGIEVVMMSPPGKYSARIEAAGFRWLPIPMDRRSLDIVKELKLLATIVDICRSEDPDAIHNFTIKCVVYGSLAAQVLGIKERINAVTGLGHVFVSASTKARLLRPVVKWLLRIALRGSQTRLILQNSDDVNFFGRRRLIDRDRIRLIKGSGVDTARFAPPKGKPDKQFRVLLAARLLWEKGIREYIDAARRLRRRADDVEFLLAGSADLGNPSSVPEQDVAQWQSEGIVKVLGHVEPMDNLMRTVNLVVLPSYYGEGVPRVLIEAAAMGLPVITTETPGCKEIVEDRVNGFLIPVKDEVSLSRKVEYLLDNPKICHQFGAAGRQKVLDEFDQQIVFRKTYAVYQEAESRSA